MGTFYNLSVYGKAYDLAMDIFRLSTFFPVEERYGLTSQIRRSSRSVCSNIAEGYRKRLYQAHFVSKLTDADMENSETMVWLDFSLSCGYIKEEKVLDLKRKAGEIGKILNFMILNPEKFS
jgi:four helix bundle protein